LRLGGFTEIDEPQRRKAATKIKTLALPIAVKIPLFFRTFAKNNQCTNTLSSHYYSGCSPKRRITSPQVA